MRCLVRLTLRGSSSVCLVGGAVSFLAQGEVVFPSVTALRSVVDHYQSGTRGGLFSVLLYSLASVRVRGLRDLFRVCRRAGVAGLT